MRNGKTGGDWVQPGLALAGFVGLGLAVGAVDGVVTATSVGRWYATLMHPPGTPPDAVFGPVWVALYVVMGVAAWRAWRAAGWRAVRLWFWQMAVNAVWSPLFFGWHAPRLALAVLAALCVLVAGTARRFAMIDRVAGGLMLPYLAWCLYALYLNAGIVWLN